MGKKHGNSIKDNERYEALRRAGASKEKAARIANTPATIAGRRGGKAAPYEEWKREDLYGKCKQIGIPGCSRMSKANLIDALRNH